MKNTPMNTVNYEHPRWSDFANRMKHRPVCDHTLTYTRAALRELGADEAASVEWLATQGGYCDCEVEFNVVSEHCPQ